MYKLSLVIPAKNEEKRINKTLSKYGSFFDARKAELPTELIVVVNDSFDATSRCIDSYTQKYPFIKKIDTPYASGKGGAVSLGFQHATGDYVGFVDADGAITPSEVLKLYEFILETPWLDGVIGKRVKATTKISFKRRVLKALYNIMVKFLFMLPYKDAQCGVKIFKNHVAKAIYKKLSNTGWTFDVNLLLVAKYLNFQILDFPVSWSEKEGSKLSLGEALILVPFELLSLKLTEVFHYAEKGIKRLLNYIPIQLDSADSKNILIFAWRDIKHPEVGGSEVYVHQIAKRLAKKHRVTIFTSQPGNLSGRDIVDDVTIIRRGNFLTVYFWAFIYYILYFDLEMDFIVDVENGLPFFTPFYSRKPKLMILHHVHKNQWFKQFPFPVALIGYFLELVVMPIAYRRVPVVTVSPSSMKELKDIGFSDKRIFLSYNAISPKIGKTFTKSITPLLVYVGRLKKYKRLEIALHTVKELLKEFPEIQLVVAGTGDQETRLRELVKDEKLEKHVEIMGFVSERKKWELLQKAWVFLMPSMKEGWGITIIEAASCATPAVCFDVPGVRDSVRRGATGLLANSKDEYKDFVRQLLVNKNLRTDLGKNGVSWSELFSWNVSAKIIENIIYSYSENKLFLSDRIYPWELDLRAESITTLATNR